DLGAGNQSVADLHLMSSGAELDFVNSGASHTFTITGGADLTAIALHNDGVIDVSSSAGSMVTLQVSGSVENPGTIQADRFGANVNFDTINVFNDGGTIAALDSGQVTFSNVSLNGGSVQADSESVVVFHGGSINNVELTDTDSDGDAAFLVE